MYLVFCAACERVHYNTAYSQCPSISRSSLTEADEVGSDNVGSPVTLSAVFTPFAPRFSRKSHTITFLCAQTTRAVYSLSHPSWLREAAVWHVPTGGSFTNKTYWSRGSSLSSCALVIKKTVCHTATGSWKWRLSVAGEACKHAPFHTLGPNSNMRSTSHCKYWWGKRQYFAL